MVKDIKEKMSPRNTTKALCGLRIVAATDSLAHSHSLCGRLSHAASLSCYVAYNIDAHDKDDTDDVEVSSVDSRCGHAIGSSGESIGHQQAE